MQARFWAKCKEILCAFSTFFAGKTYRIHKNTRLPRTGVEVLGGDSAKITRERKRAGKRELAGENSFAALSGKISSRRPCILFGNPVKYKIQRYMTNSGERPPFPFGKAEKPTGGDTRESQAYATAAEPGAVSGTDPGHAADSAGDLGLFGYGGALGGGRTDHRRPG